MESLLDLPIPIIEYIFTWLEHPEELFLTCSTLYKIFSSNHVQLNWLLNYFSNASNSSVNTFDILHKENKITNTTFNPMSPRISATATSINNNEKSNTISIFPFNILIQNSTLTELFINNALRMCIPFIDDYIYEIRRSSSDDDIVLTNTQNNHLNVNNEITANQVNINPSTNNVVVQTREAKMKEYLNQAINSHSKQIQIIQILWQLSTYLSWPKVLNSIIEYVKYAFPEWINTSFEISLGLYQLLPTEPITVLLNNISDFKNNDYTPIIQLLIDKDLLQPNPKNLKSFLSSLKKGNREKEITLIYNHWFYSEKELSEAETIDNDKYNFTIDNIHQVLMSATQSGSEELVKMILDSRITNTSESINIASREGYLSILKLLISKNLINITITIIKIIILIIIIFEININICIFFNYLISLNYIDFEKVNIQHISENDNFSELMKSNPRHPLIVALTRAIENASWRNFPSIVE